MAQTWIETTTTTPDSPDSVRFVENEKFPPKVMIWSDISIRGLSKMVFRRSKSEAVDSDMYIIVYKASFHS